MVSLTAGAGRESLSKSSVNEENNVIASHLLKQHGRGWLPSPPPWLGKKIQRDTGRSPRGRAWALPVPRFPKQNECSAPLFGILQREQCRSHRGGGPNSKGTSSCQEKDAIHGICFSCTTTHGIFIPYDQEAHCLSVGDGMFQQSNSSHGTESLARFHMLVDPINNGIQGGTRREDFLNAHGL